MSALQNYSQVVNAGLSYCTGLNINPVSDTTLQRTTFTVTDGQARNSTNTIDIFLDTDGVGTTVDTQHVGLNGLDTGTVAVSKQYALFLIADALGYKATGLLLSTSTTAPILPEGYGIFLRIGFQFTDASGYLIPFYQVGNGLQRTYMYPTAQRVLNAGNATTFTVVSVSAFSPTIPVANGLTTVLMSSAYTPATAGNTCTVGIYLNPSVATGTYVFSGSVSAQIASNAFQVEAVYNAAGTNQAIMYKVANAGDALSLYVNGFIDTL